ncbi:MAG TPA: SDR family oxidoreductase [Opitutaceae bacterium]|jgi:NAD(P)-dependent dehydrogenase (short-subunit alcohol dehydrogenase family)|nr:SDR family oxidoreductase [Opitutaceae bacterium]
MRLKDKVILVTGSTTGIGEGMARVFAREGARVIVHGPAEPDAERAGRAVAEAITRAGGQASFLAGSLEDPAVPSRLIAQAIEQHGRIDGLVNNAAVMTRGTMENTDLAKFERTLAINLRAPFLLIQAALPHFRRQGGGRVINIGSVNAYSGERNQFAYSISKGGLMTLTRNIADAYGREGIRVNQFNLGWTLTPNEFELKKREGLPDDWPRRIPKEFAPSGRLLSPEEIGWAAVYFLSEEGALINGTVMELEQFPMIGRMQERRAD